LTGKRPLQRKGLIIVTTLNETGRPNDKATRFESELTGGNVSHERIYNDDENAVNGSVASKTNKVDVIRARGRHRALWLEHLNASALSAKAKCVAVSYFLHYNVETERCDPSIERLMEKTGLSRSSVIRGRGELIASGWLKQKSGSTRCARRSNEHGSPSADFRLTMPISVSSDTQSVSALTLNQCQNEHQISVSSDTLTSNLTSNEHPTEQGDGWIDGWVREGLRS
jgi:hypothetical protein